VTDLRTRAYAQLGVPLGASPVLLRKRYKELVRRWHPDRFASDPRGQAEAAVRMREINAAYHLILASAGSSHAASGFSGPRTHASRGPLTRDEIERMVQAVGTEGPVDVVLGSLRSLGKVAGSALTGMFLVVLALRLVRALFL
jgi:DnaJ domain